MAHPSWLSKYLRMKPEVIQIYKDLEEWRDHCRMSYPAIRFDPSDLYKSHDYRAWQEKKKRKLQRGTQGTPAAPEVKRPSYVNGGRNNQPRS